MKKNSLVFMILGFWVLTGGFSLAGEEGVQIGGFISQGYMKTNKNNYLADTKDGSFQYNEMGLNFTTHVTSELKMGCQFFARDIGTVGNDKIELNWAFAEYSWLQWLGIRAGLLKIPFGFYNDIRDYEPLRTYSFLPSGVYNEYFRDGINNLKGMELYGSIPVGVLGIVKYQAQTGDMNLSADSGTAKFVTQINTGGFSDVEKFDVDRTYTWSLNWITAVPGLRLGITYMHSGTQWEATMRGTIPVVFRAYELDFYVYSIEYVYNNFLFSTETFVSDRKIRLTTNTTPSTPLVPYKDVDSLANYFNVSYRFLDWLELGSYYSYFDTDLNEKGNLFKLTDICVCARIDINANWIVKLECHIMDGLFAAEPEDGKSVDSRDPNWNLYVVKAAFSF